MLRLSALLSFSGGGGGKVGEAIRESILFAARAGDRLGFHKTAIACEGSALRLGLWRLGKAAHPALRAGGHHLLLRETDVRGTQLMMTVAAQIQQKREKNFAPTYALDGPYSRTY